MRCVINFTIVGLLIISSMIVLTVALKGVKPPLRKNAIPTAKNGVKQTTKKSVQETTMESVKETTKKTDNKPEYASDNPNKTEAFCKNFKLNLARKKIDVKNYAWNDYLPLQELYELMDYFTKKYDNVRIVDIGKSYENRTIKAVKIDFLGSTSKSKKAIVIEGGLRPKAWPAITTATYIMKALLQSNDPDVQYFVKQYVWYIAPVLNPDGYVSTWKEGQRCLMSNMKPYGKCVGVDLTGNFPFRFWYSTPKEDCTSHFHGYAPLSEPETRAWATFLTDLPQELFAYFSIVTYGRKLLYPMYSSRNTTMLAFAENAVKLLKDKRDVEFEATRYNYLYRGSSVDWVDQKFQNATLVYGIELRGGTCDVPPKDIIDGAADAFELIINLIYQGEPPRSLYPIHLNLD